MTDKEGEREQAPPSPPTEINPPVDYVPGGMVDTVVNELGGKIVDVYEVPDTSPPKQ